jgi:hypothetical protein
LLVGLVAVVALVAISGIGKEIASLFGSAADRMEVAAAVSGGTDTGQDGNDEDEEDDEEEPVAGPAISVVAPPADGAYGPDDVLSFQVTFAAPVTVSGGVPRLALTFNSGGVQADYASGSGSDTLVFSYTVQSGDDDADGILLAGSIDLNGATIRDSGGHDADTDFTPPDLSGVTVSQYAGLYAVLNFEGNFNNEGYGSDVSVTSGGTQWSFSGAQAYQGTQSLYVNSAANSATYVGVDLPQLVSHQDWEIRIRTWQNSSVNNTKNFPTLATIGLSAATTPSATSYSFFTVRYGPNAHTNAAYVARDSSGVAGNTTDISAYAVNQGWVTIILKHENGTGSILIDSGGGRVTLSTRQQYLAAYPWGAHVLYLGQPANLAGDNGYNGYIDQVEVEIFD